MRVTASQFRELYDQAPDKVAFLQNAEAAQMEVLPDLDMKQALYHGEKGRKFRRTRQEAESGKLKCPYCTTNLAKVRLRKDEHGYTCPRCRWSIHAEDLWDPSQKEVPDVREPGDATGPEMQEVNNAEPLEVDMDESLSPQRIV
jgi:hypothetical protein